jgi:maleylacetoacetate isomerase
MTKLRLYDYWRSSAAYRVRIALALKGLTYEAIPTDLPTGAHLTDAYLHENPQGLVPMLDAGGVKISQTLAIIDWLETYQPEPRLIPKDPQERALELSKALVIIADIHPLNNLRVLKYLGWELTGANAERDAWYQHWVCKGFASLEAMADPGSPYLSGTAPGLADLCLVPQMFNARRFETRLDAFPNLVRIDANCCTLAAFQMAHPDAVKGAKS